MTKRLLILLGVLLPLGQLGAQTFQRDSLLGHLVGDWVLRGSIAGKQTVHDVNCEWVLDGEYVRMHEVSRERTAAGTPAYEAIVYLGRDPHTHEYASLWLDNTAYGGFVPAGVGRGKAVADSIPFVFVDTPTSGFHTTFVYNRAADNWAWHMDNVDARGLHPFARVTLTRRSPK